jgi:hypothetical protein
MNASSRRASRLSTFLLTLSLLGASASAFAQGALAGCPLYPANNILNTPVDTLPVHPRSAAWVANVSSGGDGASRTFHMDFGAGLWEGGPIGIPYVVVNGSQPKVPVSFTWADESDAGPYPVPPNAPVEGGTNGTGDRHVLVLDNTNCILYELFYAWPQNGGASWTADAGAKFDLRSNALRPAGWTSADAAGLAVLPSLVLYDEVASGAIRHAIRFTASRTQRAYLWPARHYASTVTDLNVAPMGARFRMKASVDLNRFTGEARIIAQAMKTYGIILADNGSPWYVTGAPDERWNNSTLRQLHSLTGNDFEAVDASSLMVDPNSGEAAGGTPPPPPPPTPTPTTTSLASSLNPSTAGQSVTFTATVASSTGAPAGNVDFRDGSTVISGCATVALSSGAATCSTSALATGTRSITAAYAGNATHAASTSAVVSQVVQSAPPPPPPSTVTVSVVKSGTAGSVTSTNGAINCGSTCSAQFTTGSAVTLNASAKGNSVFGGWSGGGCSGTGSCTFTANANTQVTATFRRKR